MEFHGREEKKMRAWQINDFNYFRSGWIDSLIRGIDETEYMRKFTPRKNSSVWSESNKRRVEESILLLEKGEELGLK